MMPHEPRSYHQLQDSPFFKLRSKGRLAKVLLVSPGALRRILQRQKNYSARWKHKKEDEKWLSSPPPALDADSYRLIEIPMPDLKAIQARIADLLGRVSPPDYLFSPVKGRSYVGNAGCHVGALEFRLLDIAEYFPSCSANKVAWFFHKRMQCSRDVAAILVQLIAHEGHLPQGSPCSPIMAFFSNIDMWESLNTIATGGGCTLSVYADDITISGRHVPGELVWRVKQTIHAHGFRLKKQKEVSLKNTPADVTGVIVKRNALHLPNRQLKKLRDLREERRTATDHEVRKRIDAKIAGRLAQRNQVEGR